jgi:hypothetical protein
MTKRLPFKGGDEYDGLTKARRFLLWKSLRIKRARFRKYAKYDLKDTNTIILLISPKWALVISGYYKEIK